MNRDKENSGWNCLPREKSLFQQKEIGLGVRQFPNQMYYQLKHKKQW